MIKADFHTHTADDPSDQIPYDAVTLIDRAAALGYSALAITLHDKQLCAHDVTAYAAGRGIVLVPGIERTIAGKHVLLLNFPPDGAERVGTFTDLQSLKAQHPDGLVIAPHAFFPMPSCLNRLMETHADLFDAVEINGFYTASVDFNRRAVAWAAAHAKPLVGNGDVHRLAQLGPTYTLVDAVPEPHAICQAVKAGRVDVHRTPLALLDAVTIFADMAITDALPVRRPHRAGSGNWDQGSGIRKLWERSVRSPDPDGVDV
jgi:predicted metal-dependent phosphoesterase TrpH